MKGSDAVIINIAGGGCDANRLKENVLKEFDTAQYVTMMPQGGTETS